MKASPRDDHEMLIKRVAHMIAYEATKEDIRARLNAAGLNDTDAYLIYIAGKMYAKD